MYDLNLKRSYEMWQGVTECVAQHIGTCPLTDPQAGIMGVSLFTCGLPPCHVIEPSLSHDTGHTPASSGVII